jgi:hypothetical protein
MLLYTYTEQQGVEMFDTNPITDTAVFIGMIIIASMTATLLALGVI